MASHPHSAGHAQSQPAKRRNRRSQFDPIPGTPAAAAVECPVCNGTGEVLAGLSDVPWQEARSMPDPRRMGQVIVARTVMPDEFVAPTHDPGEDSGGKMYIGAPKSWFSLVSEMLTRARALGLPFNSDQELVRGIFKFALFWFARFIEVNELMDPALKSDVAKVLIAQEIMDREQRDFKFTKFLDTTVQVIESQLSHAREKTEDEYARTKGHLQKQVLSIKAQIEEVSDPYWRGQWLAALNRNEKVRALLNGRNGQ